CDAAMTGKGRNPHIRAPGGPWMPWAKRPLAVPLFACAYCYGVDFVLFCCVVVLVFPRGGVLVG
ncbi:hypothetical protein, partial [Stappia indica]|uniref:hypothetical protein n=1 Tax=Stappia indica TaxID=538381 RepID=UPI001AD8CEE3